jgi:flagellar hook assembly protein FlgD
MKKIFLFAIILANFVLANIYSSGIKISDDTVASYNNATNQWSGDFTKTKLKIWFVLNEAGSSSAYVKVFIINISNDTVAVLDKTNLVAGVNYVIWDGKGKNGNYVPKNTYQFVVLAYDPVGHTNCDSLWVAGYNYNGNTDFDGLTTFPYRGAAAFHNQMNDKFGNILIARGTSSGVNGAYRLRADGVYLDKFIAIPYQSTLANRYFELATLDDNVFIFPGHSYSSIGRNYSNTGGLIDTFNFKYKNARGFSVKLSATDTIIIFGCMENNRFGLLKYTYKKNVAGDTALFIDMRSLNPSGAGYIIATAIDDDENVYVAYAKTSEARKRLAKFDKNGTLVWDKSLDTDFGLTASGISYPLFSSLAIYHGKNKNSASDDKLYAYIYGVTGQSGIYEIKLDGSSITKLISPAGESNSTQAQKIGVDPAGNIIYSNGSKYERIILISPADGQNSFATCNPPFTDINVINVPTQPSNTLLAYETFNYTAGSKLTDNEYIAHSGAGQNPVLVADTNLTYPKYADNATGKATKTISGSGTREDVRKFFKGVTSGKLYVAFLFNIETAADGLADYNFHFSDSTNSSTTFKGRFFVKKDATTKKLSFAIGESQGSSSVNFSPAIYDTAKTYLALMMIDLDKPYRPNYLWINPDLSKDPDTTTAVSKILAATNYTFKYASFCFRQGSVKNTTIFDEIKITTDFKDLKVTADTVTPPPPPAPDTVFASLNEDFENVNYPNLPKHWDGKGVATFNDNYGNNGSKGYIGWDGIDTVMHYVRTPRIVKPKVVSYYIAAFSNSDIFKVYFQKSVNKINWTTIDSITAPPLGFNFVKKEYNVNEADTVYYRWYCYKPTKNGFYLDDIKIGDFVVSTQNNKLPLTFKLEQNYPNPFNPVTVIRFAIPKESKVELKIYNILGQEVATLVNDKLQAGYHTYNFNAANLPSGIYICNLKADKYKKSIKMMLVK